jgi:glucose-1-phosphate cytidylyltransferase
MKTVLLAGGEGTRLSEETVTRPKPMVEIGNRPILWHIMKGYAHFGFNDFVVALGYKGDQIKRYFTEYCSLTGDLRVHTKDGRVEQQTAAREDWTVDLVDTGYGTETGGRLLQVSHLLGDRFMMTFGDGVSNVDIKKLVEFHESHGKLATLTAVRPPARFGHVELDGDRVATFDEKPQAGEGWILGGFFVLERKALDYIEDENTYFQREPLERLAKDGELMAYRHTGFWQCMDTTRDRDLLQSHWKTGDPAWKTWE